MIVGHYRSPEADTSTLARVLDLLPQSVCDEIEDGFGAGWLLALGSRDALIVFLAVDGADLCWTLDGELHVPNDAQKACISAMTQTSIIGGEWSRLDAITFYSEAAQIAFNAALETLARCVEPA